MKELIPKIEIGTYLIFPLNVDSHIYHRCANYKYIHVQSMTIDYAVALMQELYFANINFIIDGKNWLYIYKDKKLDIMIFRNHRHASIRYDTIADTLTDSQNIENLKLLRLL